MSLKRIAFSWLSGGILLSGISCSLDFLDEKIPLFNRLKSAQVILETNPYETNACDFVFETLENPKISIGHRLDAGKILWKQPSTKEKCLPIFFALINDKTIWGRDRLKVIELLWNEPTLEKKDLIDNLSKIIGDVTLLEDYRFKAINLLLSHPDSKAIAYKGCLKIIQDEKLGAINRFKAGHILLTQKNTSFYLKKGIKSTKNIFHTCLPCEAEDFLTGLKRVSAAPCPIVSELSTAWQNTSPSSILGFYRLVLHYHHDMLKNRAKACLSNF